MSKVFMFPPFDNFHLFKACFHHIKYFFIRFVFFHDILNIHLYVHISKASILLVKVYVMVHVSAPQRSADQT